MFALLRRRRAAAPADAGMTLVELLISMTLLTIVLGMTTGFLTVALDKNSNVSQESVDSQANQTAMELITRVVRQGVYPTGWTTNNPAIIQSGSNATTLIVTSRLSSTASPSSTIRKFTFTLSGTTLSWQQADLNSCTTSGTCTYATATPQKVLMRGVQTSSTVCPLNTANTDGPFHYVYLDATGAPVSPSLATPTAAQLPTISYVTLNFYTKYQTGPQSPGCNALSDYVDLRNKS